MTSIPTVVVGGDVSGNVGQCQVNVSTVQVDWLHERSIGVNSCSGETVADYSYVNGTGMAGAIFGAVFSGGSAIMCLMFLLVFGIAVLAKIFKWS